jgi:hypothetical protein
MPLEATRRDSLCSPAILEGNELEREIISHVRALLSQLLDESGVGPIVAAQLIVSWSHTAIASAPTPPSPDSPTSHPCRPRAARRSATGSAATATAN